MTENFPNPANTSGSAAPTPQDPLEVTSQDVYQASPDDIFDAVNGLAEKYRAQMIGASGPREQKLSRDKMIDAEAASDSINYWQVSNATRSASGEAPEKFRDFLDKASVESDASEKIIAAYAFVYNNEAYESSVADVIRERRSEALNSSGTSKDNSESEQLQTSSAEAAKRQEVEAQQRVSDAVDAVEKARGVEIFENIVRFAKEKTHLYTDMHGYTALGDARQKDTRRPQISQDILRDSQKNRGDRQIINEAVMFSSLIESDTRTVTKERQVKVGRLGRTHTESYSEIETVPDSEHPVMMHNEQTGQDEPSIRFRYNFGYNDQMPVDDRRALPAYQEFVGGRDGQTVQACIDLPESMANKLKTQIEQDPSSVRELVEKLFLNNNDGRITEEYWRKGGSVGHPIRPPYEKLPSDWTIAMIDNVQEGNKKDYQVKRLLARQ